MPEPVTDSRHSLHIVSVNFRVANLAAAMIEALGSDPLLPADTLLTVVDNDSGDGSAAILRTALAALGWGERARLLALAENRGFVAGNNAALRDAAAHGRQASNILLLNPDTVPRPGAISSLREFFATHPRCGIAGAQLENEDGSLQFSSFRLPSLLTEFAEGARLPIGHRWLGRWMITHPPAGAAHATGWVSGAAILLRSQVLEDVGPLDHSFFLYFEEADVCLRAARRGWETWTVPGARVVHGKGKSTGAMQPGQSTVARPAAWHASRRHYFRKHHGRRGLFGADVARLAGIAVWQVRRRLLHLHDPDPADSYREYWRHSVFRSGFPS